MVTSLPFCPSQVSASYARRVSALRERVRLDPLGRDGDANAYVYGQSSPLLLTDPLGEKSRVCCTPLTSGGPVAAFKHCFIQTQAEAGDGGPFNTTFGVQGVKRKGCKFQNDFFEKAAITDGRTECGDWSEGCDAD